MQVKGEDPKLLIRGSMVGALFSMRKGCKFTNGMIQRFINDPKVSKKSLNYCKQELVSAVEDTLTFLKEDMSKFNNDFFDLRQQVNMIWDHKIRCLDNLREENVKKAMSEGLLGVEKHMSTILDMMAVYETKYIHVDMSKYTPYLPPGSGDVNIIGLVS